MEQIVGAGVSQLIGTWGTFGLVFIVMAWYIYNDIKNNKFKKEDTSITNDKFEVVDKKIDNLSIDLSNKYENISTGMHHINERVNNLEDRIETQPDLVYQKFKEADNRKIEMHSALLQGRINVGPKIHNILNAFYDSTNSDHVAVALFHNGTTTLTGIPYYKFDIIAEKFDLDNENDYEIAPLYKDTDIIRHNLLPLEIIQNTCMQYIIEPDCRLQDIDSILYRRAYGLGAKHLAIGIFRDENGVPAGFLGAVNFKNNEINMKEFNNCIDMLQQTYVEDIEKLKLIKQSR